MAGWTAAIVASALACTSAVAVMLPRVVEPSAPGVACATQGVRLVAPVTGRLLEPFRAPACPYCPGRRGVVLAGREGQPVLAAASGEVTFAGQVAGVLWVVVQASPRVRVSHGRLAAISRVGGGPLIQRERVEAGEVIGIAGPTTYVGATSEGRPVDPWPALSGRAHLVRQPGGSVGCPTPRTASPSGSPPTPG